MTTAQKIVKYFALSLAVFLIITIVSSIVLALTIFSDLLGLSSSNNHKNLEMVNIEDYIVEKIDIDLAATKLEIINSEDFKVETNNDKIDIKQNDGSIIISENHNFFVNRIKNYVLKLYLPEDYILSNINIESGAGKITIERLNVQELELDLGAGDVSIDYLNVIDKAEINGGVGSLVIADGQINNLDLDVGIGSSEVTSLLRGNNKISSGIGKLDINLLSNIDDYYLNLEKGLGKIKINNEDASNSSYGNGMHKIFIEAGIGNIHITTKNNF